MALPARTGGDTKDESEPGGPMSPAELRAALKKVDTRGRPSSCVIGLTRDKQAVILVDHLPKPRKLLASAKAQGQASSLNLDVASLRFGRVSVSGKQVDIAVNKAVAPAVELKLKPVMRAAGHPQFTINADPAVEDEPEDAGTADPNGVSGHPSPSGASAVSVPGGSATPNGATGTMLPPGPLGALPAAGPASGPPPQPDGTSGAETPAAKPVEALGVAALEQRLLPLVGQVTAAANTGQPGADRLRAAATTAYAALRSGDLAGAGRGVDDLEQLLGGPDGTGPTPGSPPATAASGVPPLTAPVPGIVGMGGTAVAPSLLVALRDAAQGIPAAVAADPSRKQPLVALLADARASAEAGDAAAAVPKVEALRLAIAAPAVTSGSAAGPGMGPTAVPQTPAPATPPPGDTPGLWAEGTRGGVQVADAGPPSSTTTDAAGSGESELRAPANSPSLGSRVGSFLADHLPTGRQLYGVGETTLAAGGIVLSGFGIAVGVTETGAGILATPAGGVGIPVAASGVALTAGSVALGGVSVDLMGKGLDDIFSRPPPAASSPAVGPSAPQAPAGAGPSRAPPDDGLTSARVSLGPTRLPGDTPANPAASASTDGAGTTRVQTGGATALTALDPAWAAALGRPRPAPPPLALPPEGFDTHPGAGQPTAVSTPPPDPSLVPNHTGSPPPAVNLGNLWEEFPALQPQGPDIMAMRPGPQAESKGYPGVGETLQGGPTFAGTSHLYPVKPGQQNIVTIPMTGSRRDDFAAANKAAGLTDVVPPGRDAPEDYTWHHVDNYNSVSGMGTMELVDSDAHQATLPHSGSVAQYEAVNKTIYRR